MISYNLRFRNKTRKISHLANVAHLFFILEKLRIKDLVVDNNHTVFFKILDQLPFLSPRNTALLLVL